ncbi:hypothetical protein SDRG_11128 [Saprolegnia diclina VS20]|uniref:DUF7726 domain-containing protein n=1 Tax=Saprolegnia diclina (strain VS20) TaxID=1156394 RepID=T0QCB7_SAPDV|nr:hypothetical protein SDRG_11128 [Saprolegnia diclina VS20]EQC31205.1 hypothetical protein SDRG_11128 [Saprolegnia diclina VS20]|eukprot:XP_008615378.1 hypothetical protein SDRG_11128 [Saprolegnia diclina VS20]
MTIWIETATTTSDVVMPFPALAVAPEPEPKASDASDEDSEDDPDDDEYRLMLRHKWSCQAIRSKIQKFLATKIMTQTAFLKEISANSNSYQRYMKLKGQYGGSDNQTAAAKEAAKLAKKAAPKRKKTTSDETQDDDDAPLAKKPKSTTTKLTGADRLAQIEAVTLPDTEFVYDDCDDVRSHLQQFFLAKECSQVALAAHFDLSVGSIRKFLAMHGKREGSGSIVYKAAYFFFEKLRILEQRPKSTKRQRMEKTMPGGFSLVRDRKGRWIVFKGM